MTNYLYGFSERIFEVLFVLTKGMNNDYSH